MVQSVAAAKAAPSRAKPAFQWDDPFLLDDQLGEDERLVRDTTRAYSQEKLMPRILEANRHDIVRYLWETWSPGWDYTDEAYQRSAPSFDNPDFVDIVIHSYRHRHLNAPGEERFLAVERQLAERPPITVPAIVLRGDASGFGRPSTDPSGDRNRFTNLVARRIVEGAGHDLPVQRPDTVSEALLELLA